MKTAVVGLGLIGGSIAKMLKNAKHDVYGSDISEKVIAAAISDESVTAPLTDSILAECKFVIISLYPEAAKDWLRNNADKISPGTYVTDCAGVKRTVCETGFPLAEKYGFTFVGAHPMGGTAKWGFVHSKLTLLSGAPVILTPDKNIAPEKLKTLEQFFLDIGFGEVVSSSPAEHDRIIAFSSQLAHVVSSAYVKGSAVRLRKGFSAGSYRDMTRVAKLNEKMWTELFLENADFLGDELTELIFRLAEYRQALLNKNAAELERLLREGREIKEKC